MVSAIEEQARTLFLASNQFYTTPQIELAELLVANSCLQRVFIASSGAEANEGAVKLARGVRDESRSLLRSALIGLGRACELAKQYRPALDAYREALVFAPDDAELLAGIGNIYFRQKKYTEAEEFYRQALTIDPSHQMSNYNLGLVYARTGRYDLAIAQFTGTSDLPETLVGSIEGSSLTAVDRSRAARIAAFRSQLGKMGGAPPPSRSGKPPPYTYALGMTYYEQGDNEAAIDAFSRALDEDASLAEAHLYIGNVRVRQERLEDAVAAYKDALRVNPEFVEAYNNMGCLFAEQDNTAAAMDAYHRALELNPRFHDARTNLGLLYAEEGRYDQAIQAYETVIKADAGIAEAHNNLSIVYLKQGRMEEAIIQGKKAIALRRDFPEAYNNLGLAYGHRAYFDDVVDTWRKIASAWTGSQGVTVSQNNGKARKGNWLLIRRVPAQSSGVGGRVRERYREGVDQAAQGLFDNAVRSFQAALAAKPGWYASQLAIGSVHLAQERWEDAAAALTEAVVLSDSDPLAHTLLAIALAMHGEYGRAADAWKRAVQQIDGEARTPAKEALDIVYERQKLADEAIKAFLTAVAIKPDFAKAYFNLGVFYDQIHRYPDAIASYERVAARVADIPIIHFRLGVAYSRVGRMQEAQASIQKYISMVVDPMELPQVETFLKRMHRTATGAVPQGPSTR